MWTPIVNRAFSVEDVAAYITTLDFSAWRPSLIVWHNTAAPTLAQWRKTAAQDRAQELPSGQTRINNLVSYFKSQGWSSGPHWFVADDLIWAFTPSNRKGTHTPSWNGISLGIEMCADFDTESPDSGPGLAVKNNCIALTAALCERLGLNPETAIRMHYEDKRTTHACPGKMMRPEKAAMIEAVMEYMGHGGGHNDELPTVTKLVKVEVADNDYLNLRENSTVSSPVVAQLANGAVLSVWNSAKNGATEWLQVKTEKGQEGWVAARFTKGE